MSYHRFINLDVGFSLKGSGRKGGESGGEGDHASYKDAKELAKEVEAILRRAMSERGGGLLSRYTLEQVEPTPANGGPEPGSGRARA